MMMMENRMTKFECSARFCFSLAIILVYGFWILDSRVSTKKQEEKNIIPEKNDARLKMHCIMAMMVS